MRVGQIRDRESSLAKELAGLAERLGLPAEVAPERLGEEERTELAARLERLERRRERLGPVNPLAEREYEEAIAHVEELEAQRKDLEAALAELQGLIRETDRLIRESFEETFEAAASNFEEVIERLFPGGRGQPAPRERAARPARGARRRGGRDDRRARLRRAASGRHRRRTLRQTRPRACRGRPMIPTLPASRSR